MVIKTLDSTLFVSIDEKIYEIKELQMHKKVSLELDQLSNVVAECRNINIPPMSHPWKAASFKKQIEKTHTKHVYA